MLKRKPGLSMAEFRRHYEERHVPLGMKHMDGPTGYSRTYLDHVPGQPEPEFDVITLLEFSDVATRDRVLSALLAGKIPPDIIADEEAFLDRPCTRFCAVSECETLIESS